MEERALLAGLHRLLGGGKFPHGDAVEIPAVAAGDGAQLVDGFRERDVEDFFAATVAFKQVLQRKRGFADARVALNEVEVVRRQSAAQYVVEPSNTGKDQVGRNSRRQAESSFNKCLMFHR